MLIDIPVTAFNVYFGCYLIGFKKKKLSDIYKSKHIRVNRIRYNELKNIWNIEFKKFINVFLYTLRLRRIV